MLIQTRSFNFSDARLVRLLVSGTGNNFNCTLR